MARQLSKSEDRPRVIARGWHSSWAVGLLTLAIRVYQLTIAPAQTYFFGATGGCRYTPTCSAYAAEALQEHGAVAGTFLTVRRVCRCHPWGGCGHDPVPGKSSGSGISATGS